MVSLSRSHAPAYAVSYVIEGAQRIRWLSPQHRVRQLCGRDAAATSGARCALWLRAGQKIDACRQRPFSEGGQAVLDLYRSLYHQPRILFLDEGTAHLDVDSERRINETLKQLRMTRISVAHRPPDGSDRIVRIGKILEWESRGPAPAPIADRGTRRLWFSPVSDTDNPAG